MNHGPDRTNNTSLRNMDTEALRSLLMMELSAEGNLNIEKIQEITDIIAEREQLDVPDVDASWKDFQNQYRSTEPLHTLDQEQPVPPTRKSKHKALRRVFLVAAVLASLLLGATLTAQAADYDLWGAVAQWTSETFGFTLQQSDEKLDTISPGLQPLWDAIQDAGISDPLLPTYLPEEYQQVELSIDTKQAFFCATYQRTDGSVIQLTAERGKNSGWSLLQKDADAPECYIWNEIEFYVMTNMGQWVAVWSGDEYEYFITCANESDTYQMIESVHKENP